MLESTRPAMRLHAWAIPLIVLVALTGCATGTEATSTRSPDTQPSAASVAPAEEVRSTSQPVTEATRDRASVEPEPTPTLTPTVVTPPAPLAALVNGEYIFLADYQQEVAHYEQTLVARGLDPGSEAGQARLTQMQQEVLEGMIDFALIAQGAAALGLKLDSEVLHEALEADIAAGGGEVAFEEWLKATGQSRGEYRKMLRHALLSQMVLEAVSSGVPETTDSGATSDDLRMAAFEQWLAGQHETAVIERFAGD